MFVISIVVTITILAQKPFDRGTALLYNRAFTSLATAVYNIEQDLVSPQTLMGLTTIEFCEKLAKTDTGYLNTSVAPTCNANTVPLTAPDASFIPANVQFITSNGMTAYLSAVDSYPITIGTITYDNFYRVVFFDLNGENRPNTAVYAPSRMNDIVAFLVTEYGDVLPLGYPEIDKRYLTAKVHYPDGDTEDELDKYSSSMSYYEAKANAWGVSPTNYNIEEIMSLKFNDDLPAGNIKITAFPVVTGADTTNGCVNATTTNVSACEVEFNQYIN